MPKLSDRRVGLIPQKYLIPRYVCTKTQKTSLQSADGGMPPVQNLLSTIRVHSGAAFGDGPWEPDAGHEDQDGNAHRLRAVRAFSSDQANPPGGGM